MYSVGTVPSFLTSTLNEIGWSNSCLGRFNPGNKFVLIEMEAGWFQESVWTIWRREKRLAPDGIQTPARPAQRLINY